MLANTPSKDDVDEMNFTLRKPSLEEGRGDLNELQECQMSSSHIEDSGSVDNYQPASLQIVHPLIPREEEINFKQAKDSEIRNTNSHFIEKHLDFISPKKQSVSLRPDRDAKRNSKRLSMVPTESPDSTFPKRVNLKTTMKGNKNFNIVIVDRSPLEKSMTNNFNLSAKRNYLDENENLKLSKIQNEAENDGAGVENERNEVFPSSTHLKPRNLSFSNTHHASKSNDNLMKIHSKLKEMTPLKYNTHKEISPTQENKSVKSKKSENDKEKNNDLEIQNVIIKEINLQEQGGEVITSNVETNIKIEGMRDYNFNFDNQARRYKRQDLAKAKNFFKYRYISDKLMEYCHMMDIKNKDINAKNFNSNNSGNIITNQNNLFNDKLNGYLNSPSDMVYSSEDKHVIKFTCLFLQKIEKAIFLFNMKKYEDSYNYLRENKLIKNEEEFGEILLIYPGFDKFIIGEFLSKEKAPNQGGLILNNFMKKMDFTDTPFLASFRYLLFRINLPKDSALILNIIDVFTTVYYRDNLTNKLFKDTTALYLLASTVLALNTMFHCSIPGANIKMMKKEEFIKMNENVEPLLSANIYDEIKENKLDIIYDYNEQIYKKIEFEDVGRTNRKEGGIGIINSAKSEVLNTEKTSIKNADELIHMLKCGQTFIKYGKKGEPHERFVYLSKNEEYLYWKPLSCCFNTERWIKTKNLINIYIGTSNSQVFERYRNKIPPEFELNCFSILAKKRSLDLKGEDPKLVKKWMHALKYLIKRVISKFEVKKKKLKELINRKEIISDFWRTEILPNWSQYRQFLFIENEIDTFNNSHSTKFSKNKNVGKVTVQNENHARKSFMNVFNTEVFKNKLVIEEKDRADVAYLWFLGIPDWLRKNMWSIIISNNLEINENLFNFYLQRTEKIEFFGETFIDRDHVPDKSLNVKEIGQFEGIPILDGNKIFEEDTLCDQNQVKDPLLNEIINDVNKCYRKFKDTINLLNIEEKKFKDDLFKLLRMLTNYRPDITYSKQVSYIFTIFYLNCEDYYTTFLLATNFTIPSFLIKFYNRDEIFIKSRLEFLERLIKSHTPLTHKHFKNLDVSIRLFFYDWVEYLFIKYIFYFTIRTFKYETVIRIFDCLLIRGEILIYEIAIALIKLQENDLVNSTVKNILESLSFFPEKFTDDDLFAEMEKIDINDEYNLLVEESELANEKSILYSAFLYY